MRNGLACWCFLGLLLLDCSGDEAAALYRAAEEEESRNNHAAAQEIYERILRDFPDTGAARESRKRVTASLVL